MTGPVTNLYRLTPTETWLYEEGLWLDPDRDPVARLELGDIRWDAVVPAEGDEGDTVLFGVWP